MRKRISNEVRASLLLPQHALRTRDEECRFVRESSQRRRERFVAVASDFPERPTGRRCVGIVRSLQANRDSRAHCNDKFVQCDVMHACRGQRPRVKVKLVLELLCDGGDLLNSVLVSCKVAFECLVLLLHRLTTTGSKHQPIRGKESDKK